MKSSGFVSKWKSVIIRTQLMLLISMLAVFGSSGLMAQPPETQKAEEAFEVPADGLSQRQALDRVRARFPGNIISVNEVNQDGRIRFRFRIDNEGNIYTLYVDRVTGAITRE